MGSRLSAGEAPDKTAKPCDGAHGSRTQAHGMPGDPGPQPAATGKRVPSRHIVRREA